MSVTNLESSALQSKRVSVDPSVAVSNFLSTPNVASPSQSRSAVRRDFNVVKDRDLIERFD